MNLMQKCLFGRELGPGCRNYKSIGDLDVMRVIE